MTSDQEFDRDELTMLEDPKRWPMYPRLPLKRHVETGLPDCGFIFCSGGKPDPIVYLSNVWDHTVDDAAKEEYDSFEDLMAAGWKVD